MTTVLSPTEPITALLAPTAMRHSTAILRDLGRHLFRDVDADVVGTVALIACRDGREAAAAYAAALDEMAGEWGRHGLRWQPLDDEIVAMFVPDADERWTRYMLDDLRIVAEDRCGQPLGHIEVRMVRLRAT